MSFKRLMVLFLFLDFLAFTVYAVVSEPPTAFFTAVSANFWSIQITLDLCIALGFGAIWMWRDAKSRGINPLPWVIAIPFTGSIALLAYAVRRGWATASEPAAATATA